MLYIAKPFISRLFRHDVLHGMNQKLVNNVLCNLLMNPYRNYMKFPYV